VRFHPTLRRGRHLPTEQVQCTYLPTYERMDRWVGRVKCDAFINPDVFIFKLKYQTDLPRARTLWLLTECLTIAPHIYF